MHDAGSVAGRLLQNHLPVVTQRTTHEGLWMPQ